MPIRTAEAEWRGDLASGSGIVEGESEALDAAYSFASRFEEGSGTNPEELIAAAHAGCYSMALSHALAEAGHDPGRIRTTARVVLEMEDEGPAIARIELECEAEVPGIDDDAFREFAEDAKEGCPVSRALSSVPIVLEATLTP